MQINKAGYQGNQKISASVMDIDITKLDSEESMPKQAPKPISQYGHLISKPSRQGVLKKHNSGDFDAVPTIPLHEIDDDFAPRNKHVGYQPPLKHDTKQEVKPKIETKSKDELSTMNMIKNIKKQREQRINRSQDISHKFTDQTSSITMASGTSDDQMKTTNLSESRSKTNNDEFEEDKVDDDNKEATLTINLNQEDEYLENTDCPIDAFEFRDENFEEDFSWISRKGTNLDEIKEDEELDDIDLEIRFIKKIYKGNKRRN